MTSLGADEAEAVRRVYAHLLVHDPNSAVKEAEKLLQLYPESSDLQLAYLQALTERGDEAIALQKWMGKKDELVKNRRALEILAWGVLKKGDHSSQLNIHFNALIGSALTRDVRAVPMLIQAMRGTNALFRLLAIRFAAHYGDGPLQDELKRLLVEEKVWFVRLEVLQAIGKLRMQSVRESLKEIIGNKKTLTEEKAHAILALVQMYDAVRPEDLSELLKSNRAGLRELGCELISYFDLHGHLKELMPLLQDSSPDVRAHALRTIGLLKFRISEKKLETLMEDSSPLVAITACWVSALQGIDKGIENLGIWLKDIHPRWRLVAAVTLSSCGKSAFPLMIQEMEKNEDPFVRVNLAMGLIGQRAEVEKACTTLSQFLEKDHETYLMWDDNFQLRMLAPSLVSHIEQIPNYPKVIDQKVRLDLLNILCILQYPKAQEAIKGFVKNETWGITGAAISVLLEEGDEEAMVIIRQLLKDEDAEVRVQAAFLLAMVGRDPEALKVLTEVYPHMNREMKIQILEAIGHVGSMESIPFLVDILNEPFQLLRVVAASAIIQCLCN